MLEYLSYLPRLPVHYIQFSNVIVNCEIPNTFKMRHFTVTTFTSVMHHALFQFGSNQ